MLRGVLVFSLAAAALALTYESGARETKQIGRTMTFDLESRMTCFFEPLLAGHRLMTSVKHFDESKIKLQLRVTSPSGDLSEWSHGDFVALAEHDIKEDGDHEICVFSARPIRVNLNVHFFDPAKSDEAFAKYLQDNDLHDDIQKRTSSCFENLYKIFYSIKFYNSISVKDEKLQERNSEYIKNFSVGFSLITVIIAFIQIYTIRKFFRVDKSRISI